MGAVSSFSFGSLGLPLKTNVRQCAADTRFRMDTIPDFFPSDWGKKKTGGGGGGLRIPDTFNPDSLGLELEKPGGKTAVLERPAPKVDHGKMFKVRPYDASPFLVVPRYAVLVRNLIDRAGTTPPGAAVQ